MKQAGIIILCRFPQTDFETGKLRRGLRNESVLRVERLAVVEEEILLGEIWEISEERLRRIKRRLAEWLNQ